MELKAMEKMFKLNIGEYSEREGYKGSEFAPAYEDKDGDLMLVGDVPWEYCMAVPTFSSMSFATSCSVSAKHRPLLLRLGWIDFHSVELSP
ncbi:Auxin-induced protein IAA4 [Datura stramonium]|uniref:Auxin-responsive protein n=1 Tax=Datura stramonium TaxID=4076 RepID=A0ABS8VPT7_DATST|nr:Auxin-induced protein IAA4 [Datura stramonium]